MTSVDRRSTKEAVRSFIVANFYVADPHALGDDLSLLGSGILDSTGVLEVVSFIEERFGVKVRDEELLPENLDSIASIARFVEWKRAAPEAGSDQAAPSAG